MEDPDFSLLSLESELTCCICLSTFDCPVTIPCGHNFCQACLLDTWTATYDCPQCRTHYAVKPQLKKNTVLNTVVETFKERLRNSDLLVSKGDGGEAGKDERAEVNEKAEKSNKAAEHDGVRCDTCMEAKASKTCLTCMASFCAEHLRPHLDNPVFHVHQLTEPAGDLMERICMEHNKPVELYCPQHGRLVCVLCLNQKHKQCTLVSPDQQLIQKKSDMKKMLALLDRKIGQNESVIARVTDKQQALKDDADMIRLNMALEYQQIKDMLANDEHEASGLLDQELASAQKKLSNLMKLFKDNVKSLSKSKEEIKSLIQQPKTMVVLQASVDLPRAATIDVYAPQCNLDSPKVKAAQEFAVQLKEEMSQIFRQPLENRPALIKTTEDTKDNKEKNTFLLETPPLQVKTDKKTQQKKKLTSTPKNAKGHLKKKFSSMENLLGVDGKTKLSAYASGPPLKTGEVMDLPTSMTAVEKRHNLLKYGRELTFNSQTAHKRLILSEGFTVVSVSNQPEPANIPDNPQRFAMCSQVLATQSFTTGRHYWEVRIVNNKFTAIGLAYHSINRKGASSRLGRNAKSWCVEWFDVKLSAWHDGKEVVLPNPNPKRVGVLLDLDASTATFYNVTDRAYPFHSFVFPFRGALFPAFWIFSCDSSISLCKLQD
ncbi:E3 ubiquitin/ISG15 ligase TRIM25 isoform X2 [Nerophis ophidion]|uniref:E3 ubiquitin/ISG15 ligase TRIM25 isoform X2 n=1 Tax=Nerophis ophidion TaxID=159077 RepID=UPI002AE05B20|nr:E3 ubiquitin/ISG15 ligase TRIM25 isoform X2 [Nerophis ophidion]